MAVGVWEDDEALGQDSATVAAAERGAWCGVWGLERRHSSRAPLDHPRLETCRPMHTVAE
eukprot:60991-Chlamydomonas_euryale.AAC.1